jgi:hypothetical protein
MSEKKTSGLWPALCGFQSEMTSLKRTSKVKFEARNGSKREYDYVDLGSALDVIMPKLTKHGLVLTTKSVYDEIRAEKTTSFADGKSETVSKVEKTIYGIEAKVTHAESGESITETFYHDQSVTDIKDRGSLITYMRRYAIFTLLNLSAEGEDDDNNKGAPKGAQTPAGGAQGQPEQQKPAEGQKTTPAGAAKRPAKTAEEAEAQAAELQAKKARQDELKKKFATYDFSEQELAIFHRANLTTMNQVVEMRSRFDHLATIMDGNKAMVAEILGNEKKGGDGL